MTSRSPHAISVRLRTALMVALIAGVTAVGLVIAGARAQAVTTHPSAPPATSQPAVGDVVTLLEQRRDAYRRIEQIVETQAAQGAASPTELHEARIDRLQAELELADTQIAYDRIQRAIVAELRREEDRVAAAVAAGRATETDALHAKINRLDAEIEIALDAEQYDEHEE